MDLEIVITESKNEDFANLIKQLDADLSKRYGELLKQYDKHNKVDYINYMIVAYKENVPVACGAFKRLNADSAELKRIFVVMEHRRQGLAKLIVSKLEELARNKGFKYALLETGIKQYEAIALYKNNGFEVIENFEPYIGNVNSICMRKAL
jgi:ribosomal protein S18 acetylase RimI-like enzyme